MFRQDCTCPALLEDERSHYPYGTVTLCGSAFLTDSGCLAFATGLVRVRSPLLAESRLMSFPPGRKSADQSSFAAPRGLSQRSTSFIASQRQGIHQTPLRHLIALIINAHPRDQKSVVSNQAGVSFPISDF